MFSSVFYFKLFLSLPLPSSVYRRYYRGCAARELIVNELTDFLMDLTLLVLTVKRVTFFPITELRIYFSPQFLLSNINLCPLKSSSFQKHPLNDSLSVDFDMI